MPPPLPAARGVDRRPSPYSVGETLDRLEAALHAHGIKTFARIDQAAEAAAVGLSLRPTQLLIFGDPKTGTPLMDRYPSIALDLPLKALAWQDENGQVWLDVNSPASLQERHGLPTPPFGPISALVETALGQASVRSDTA